MRFHLRRTTVALTLLSACTAPRPDGAYTPAEPMSRPGSYEQTDKPEPDDQKVDQPTDDPAEDVPGPDASEPQPTGQTSEPGDAREAVAGRYLMRVDYYSTAVSSQGITSIKVANRLGNLMVLDLKLVDGALIGRETMCRQEYEHKCLSGCSSWTTALDGQVLPLFSENPIERAYTVDASGKLSAAPSALALGYDDPAPTKATIPTTDTDPKVWVIQAGQTGVGTEIKANVSGAQIVCRVSAAQLFATKFGGQLDVRKPDALSGKVMAVDGTGSAIEALAVEGTPSIACTKEQVGNSSTSDDQAFVSFAPLGNTPLEASGCPTTTSGSSPWNSAFSKLGMKVSVTPPVLP